MDHEGHEEHEGEDLLTKNDFLRVFIRVLRVLRGSKYLYFDSSLPVHDG